MNFKELFEGTEPKMPGAPKGIQIMTPQQFVAKAGDMPGEEEVDEGKGPLGQGDLGLALKSLGGSYSRWHEENSYDPDIETYEYDDGEGGYYASGSIEHNLKTGEIEVHYQDEEVGADIDETFHSIGDAMRALRGGYPGRHGGKAPKHDSLANKTLAGPDDLYKTDRAGKKGTLTKARMDGMKASSAYTMRGGPKGVLPEQGVSEGSEFGSKYAEKLAQYVYNVKPALNSEDEVLNIGYKVAVQDLTSQTRAVSLFSRDQDFPSDFVSAYRFLQKRRGVTEGEDHLDRIRKLSGLYEATTLPASSRDLKGQEFQDYMNRIKGTDDIDKKTGQVKLDKKGNEKYVSGKTKSDKYKMPYIHRSSIIEYLGPDGKTYDEDKIKQSLSQRPKSLLKQNEKMKHSNGEFEQFFNVGFAALTGIAVDEQTNNLIIVNTCPGAGSCKVDCFAMKGGKVQFKAAWQSDGRILTYLLNDPSGFFNQLSNEISKEEAAGKKGDKKFPKGWQTTIRWHDAGDFFSPEYLDLALKMAAKHPDTKFYAYTKMAAAALGNKPPNFIINWSEGANTSQEKQVKAKDANLDTTKNSRIVPDEIFQDLLVKDEKKNLVKGSEGQWQVQPDKLPELKQRLAKEYGLSSNSILNYDEYMAKRKSIPAGMKYNVIVAPGEGDISANDPNIISTLLLKH